MSAKLQTYTWKYEWLVPPAVIFNGVNFRHKDVQCGTELQLRLHCNTYRRLRNYIWCSSLYHSQLKTGHYPLVNASLFACSVCDAARTPYQEVG